jgi:N-acetyl-anhydromuramyl-L-alanine amidase AmpD
MTQSPEYPDLLWMPPRSWSDANRTAVQLVVIHTTEGAARASAAEDGAAYDQRRTDGTSTHYFHDSDSTVQCVRTADQAHTARTQGNRRGIHHELCTRAGTAAWGDAYHLAMLRRAAKQAARDAKKWGIPVRHVTADQVAAGAKGFCGHRDITAAFPADNGTHTDPGANFPWSQFLDMVRAELEEDDVAKFDADDKKMIDETVRAAITSALTGGLGDVVPRWTADGGRVPDTDPNPTMGPAQALYYIGAPLQQVKNNTTALLAAVKALPADVLDALAEEGQSDEQTAAVLKAALGDRAAAVGRLLTA